MKITKTSISLSNYIFISVLWNVDFWKSITRVGTHGVDTRRSCGGGAGGRWAGGHGGPQRSRRRNHCRHQGHQRTSQLPRTYYRTQNAPGFNGKFNNFIFSTAIFMRIYFTLATSYAWMQWWSIIHINPPLYSLYLLKKNRIKIRWVFF